MKTSSAKAKGRRLQQQIANDLLMLGQPYGLEPGDVESRGMGQNGEDIMLSPAARRLFDLSIECKNVEALNVVGTFLTHFDKYKKNESLSLLVHARNRLPKDVGPLVTLRWMDLASMLSLILKHMNTIERQIGFKSKSRPRKSR